jgi:hypothetical protein
MNPNNRLRWIGEVVAPLLEGGEPKIHSLWERACCGNGVGA